MREILARAVQFSLRSRGGTVCAVIAVGVLGGLFEFLVARWMVGVKLDPDLHAALHASIVGLGAGFATWVVLLGIIERRRILAEELHRLAELNHSVRNSLELIVLANYDDADWERKMMILDCTDRIDQKLRELFPLPRKPGAEEAARSSRAEGGTTKKSPGVDRASRD